MARLTFSPPDGPLLVDRTENDWQAVQRGTVQHEILEGHSAVVFSAGDDLEINVDCRVDAGSLEGSEVRYALVASLEIRDEVGVDIHAEVQAQIAAEVAVRARQRT